MSTKRTSWATGWTGRDRHRLRVALGRATGVRQLRRLEAVLLVASGHKPPAAAALTGQSRQSVYNALRRYRRQHTRQRTSENLQDGHRTGRPRAAVTITGAKILQALRQDPRACGHQATTWTVGLLADHLHRRWGEPISPYTLRRRMHALKLRWKRPRYVYQEPDPAKAQKKGAFDGV